MKKELWFTEKQTPDLAISCKTKGTLYSGKTEFQEIDVIDTITFGRMLLLDGIIMTTDNDEFVYHEMIAHVPMNTHPNPRKVLVIGGGDGGTIREVIKHPTVEKATLVEIDKGVIDAAKEFFPQISSGFQDSRVEVIVDDGIKHVNEKTKEYDVIIVDSTDPIGPAVGLFSKDFYKAVFNALTDDGLFVAQTESPFFNKDLITQIVRDVSDLFPITKLYLAHIPTYPGGMWSFTMGSKQYDPETVERVALRSFPTKYYNHDLHYAIFKLPQFVKEILSQAKEK